MKFLTKLLKKQKPIENIEEEQVIVPNLMETDMNMKIDLMAVDPISTEEHEVYVAPKKNEIIEQTGLEDQLVEEIISEKIVDMPQTEEISIIPNAFNMAPVSEEEPIDILETENVNLQRTQNFCKECGTPNDILNKFCVSCGYNFK